MATQRPLTPLEQLELQGATSDSGVVDRIASHQRIAVPHWVETHEGCLVGAYSSWMSMKVAMAEIKNLDAEGDTGSAAAVSLARARQMAADQSNSWRQYATMDEKVAAELVAADRDDVVSVEVDHSILTGFLGLHARKAASIEAFARRKGMLHTYTERFVSKNTLTTTSMWKKHYMALPKHIREEDEENGVDAFEPIAYWQAFSKFAFLTLRLATQLDDIPTRDEKPISVDDWEFFEHFLDEPPPRSRAFEKVQKLLLNTNPEASKVPFSTMASTDKLRTRFCVVLNKLQDIGDVKLELRWEKSTPTLEFRVTGLVSVIASQLLMAASQRENFVLCKECLAAFRPWQQPLTGYVDLYCEDCRDEGAPQRNATRRYRTTQKYRDTLQRGKSKKIAAAQPEKAPS